MEEIAFIESSTTIELTPLAAEQFILFQKYYKKINHLIDAKALDLKDGNITIHVDSGGHWKNVQVMKNNYPLDKES